METHFDAKVETMKIKTVEIEGKTYAVLNEQGLPVYVHDDGKEVGFDAAHAVQKIGTLNAEAKGHREAKEAAETALKAFEGLDAEKAKAALTTVQNLDDKKLVEAGEVEKMKSQLSESFKQTYEPQIKQLTEERDAFQSQLHNELIGGGFARSKFVTDKLTIPSDMAQAMFGKNMKVEDGKVVAFNANGERILSRINHGDIAGFDEALEILVSEYQHKDSIIKGSQSNGGGFGGQGGGSAPTGIKRSSLSVKERSDFIKEHGQDAYLKLPK